MISLEEFEQMTMDIVETLPPEFFRELSGGVMVMEERKMHPESVSDDLSILGEYVRHRHLGRYVVIYYGSFMRIYGSWDYDRLKDRVRKTVLHEFRHHLESLAGEKGLEIEDAIFLAKYRKKHKKEMLDE